MKQLLATLFYVLQTWAVILAIAFAPLKAGAEAARQTLTLENPTITQPVTGADIRPPQGERTIIDGNSSEANVHAIEDASSQPVNPEHFDTHAGATTTINGRQQNVQAMADTQSTPEEQRRASPRGVLGTFREAANRVARATVLTARDQVWIYDEATHRRDRQTGEMAERQARRAPMPINTLLHFPAEATIFYAGMGALAIGELNNPLRKSGKNPAAIDQFIHHTTRDPIGAASFYSFMLVNSQFNRFFTHLGVFSPGSTPASQRVKAVFRQFVPHLGMSAGFLMQTIVSELAHDPNVGKCLRRWRSQAEAQNQEVLQACEQAYETWALSRKLVEYKPLIYAMVATNILQMQGVQIGSWLVRNPRFLALARIPGIGVILGKVGMGVKFVKGRVFPTGGIGVKLVNIIAFIKLSEMVQPWFNRVYGNYDRAKWIVEASQKFEERMNHANSTGWQPQRYANREEQKENDPVELAKRVGLKYSEFRSYTMQLGWMNYQNWTQALTNFQSTYVSSFGMYEKMINDVKAFRERGNTNRYQGAAPGGLYLARENPTYLPGTLMPKNMSSDAIRNIMTYIRDFFAANERNLSDEQKRTLRQINSGLESAYRDLSPAELNAEIQRANLNNSSLSAEQRASIAYEIRANRVMRAMQLLQQTAQGLRNQRNGFELAGRFVNGNASELFGALNSMSYETFIWHLHMRYREQYHAVTVAGFDYYTREIANNTDLIQEEARRSAPPNYGRAFTPYMQDFLLASMVCGPKTQGGGAARANQTSWYSRIMNFITPMDQERDAFANLSLVEYTPGSGWKFLPPRIVDDNVADANFCGAEPARAKWHDAASGLNEWLLGRSITRQSISFASYFNVYTGEFTVNGQQHYGLLPIVKFYLKPQFTAANQGESTALFTMWQNEVVPQVQRAIVEMQTMYRRLVEEDFMPIWVSGQYENAHGRKVHYGAGWNLRDEGKYYRDWLKRLVNTDEMESLLQTYEKNLALMILMFSRPDAVKRATQIIMNDMRNQPQGQQGQGGGLEALAELNDDYMSASDFTPEQINAVRTAADPAAQAAVGLLMQAKQANVQAIKQLIQRLPLRPVAKAVAEQLTVNMEQVIQEAQGYNGIMRAANGDAMPEATDLGGHGNRSIMNRVGTIR